MSRAWTATDIALAENRRYIWRAAGTIADAMIPVWILLALTGILIGTALRLGSQEVPNVYFLLDVCGAAMWLAGWPLAAGLAESAKHAQRYLARVQAEWQVWLTSGLAVIGICFAVALSPVGLLLAYDPWFTFQEISTQDTQQIDVRLGGLLLVALTLGGACFLLCSALVGILSRRAGNVAGPLLWGLTGLVVNLAFVGSLSGRTGRANLAGEHVPVLLATTLGSLARTKMGELSNPQVRYEYLQSLISSTVGTAILAFAILVALALIAAHLFPQRRKYPVQRIAISCWLGIIVAVAYSTLHHLTYLSDPYAVTPGEWTIVFTSGTIAALAFYWILALSKETKLPVPAVWLWWPVAAVLGWMAGTAPSVQAGLVPHSSVLILAITTLTVLLALFQLLDVIETSLPQPLSHIVSGMMLAFVLVLLLPVTSEQSYLMCWVTWSTATGPLAVTLGLALVVILISLRRSRKVAQPKRLAAS